MLEGVKRILFIPSMETTNKIEIKKDDEKMLVYHGSPNKFETFDYNRIGTNGTNEGFGFYFTSEKRIAENYCKGGYLYKVQLNGKKLSGDKLTITENEYIKLVKFLDNENEYLSNYGDKGHEGYNVVLNRAIEGDFLNSEDDASLLGGIINAYGGTEDVLQAVYELLGYGFIETIEVSWGRGQRVYVALTNDCIEIVEINKIESV